MAIIGKSKAVLDAIARRVASAARRRTRMEWFIKKVKKTVSLTLEQRVVLATEYLKTKIVKNLSVPVGRIGKRVIERSQPGEFPRAETTLLMKSIFTAYTDGQDDKRPWYEGHVGTPLNYGVILELRMDRPFLARTLYEETSRIREIMESGGLAEPDATPAGE